MQAVDHARYFTQFSVADACFVWTELSQTKPCCRSQGAPFSGQGFHENLGPGKFAEMVTNTSHPTLCDVQALACSVYTDFYMDLLFIDWFYNWFTRSICIPSPRNRPCRLWWTSQSPPLWCCCRNILLSLPQMENMSDGYVIILNILAIGQRHEKHMTLSWYACWIFSCMFGIFIPNSQLRADKNCSTASSTAGVSGYWIMTQWLLS